MKQRMVLWGALVVLVAGAVGLVVVANGGAGGAPALPLSVGSGEGGGDVRAASVAALDLADSTTYVPADELPAGGGVETAYRLAHSVDEATVRDIATALGIDGDPTEQDGTWHVAEGEMALDVYGPAASWSAYRNAEASVPPSRPGDDGGSTGSPVAPDAPVSDAGAPVVHGEACVEQDDATECTIESSGSGSAGVAVAVACPSDPAVLCPDPRTPEQPADLPSEDEARGTALDLLAAAGTDVEGADVQVTYGIVQWMVTIEPRLGGLPAPGIATFVAVGAGGRIDSASGYVGAPEELGDYELIDTRAALDRLNDGSWGFRTLGASSSQGLASQSEANTGSAASAGSASPETTIPANAGSGRGNSSGGDSSGSSGAGSIEPAGGDQPHTLPAPADPPRTGTIPPTTGTVGPTTIVDGVAGQIAPGEPAPGGGWAPAPQPAPAPAPDPVEVAVTDAEVVLVGVPSWDDTGTYLVPGYRFTAEDGSEPIVPALTDDVVTPPPDGQDGALGRPTDPVPLPAVQPDPRSAMPETTVAEAHRDPAGREVDIVLEHCGIEPLEVDGRRWVADPPPFDDTNAPPELTHHGTFTVAPSGESAIYTDDSGIAFDLVPVRNDWQPPPCD